MTGERIDALRRRHMSLDLLLDARFAIRPLDCEALLGEQAFVVSHQFRQTLERRRGFENGLIFFSITLTAWLPMDELRA